MDLMYRKLRNSLSPNGTMIFATTTPVPPSYDAEKRVNSDVVELNARARKLFGPTGKYADVRINDLYSNLVEIGVPRPRRCSRTFGSGWGSGWDSGSGSETSSPPHSVGRDLQQRPGDPGLPRDVGLRAHPGRRRPLLARGPAAQRHRRRGARRARGVRRRVRRGPRLGDREAQEGLPLGALEGRARRPGRAPRRARRARVGRRRLPRAAHRAALRRGRRGARGARRGRGRRAAHAAVAAPLALPRPQGARDQLQPGRRPGPLRRGGPRRAAAERLRVAPRRRRRPRERRLAGPGGPRPPLLALLPGRAPLRPDLPAVRHRRAPPARTLRVLAAHLRENAVSADSWALTSLRH